MSFTNTSPNESATERRGGVNKCAYAFGFALVLLASFLYAPWSTTGPVFCPFRYTIGMPCPGCGLTRSFCAMSQGEWVAALECHLFGPLLFLMCVLAIPVLLVESITGRRPAFIGKMLFSRQLMLLIGWTLIVYHGCRLLIMVYANQVIPALKSSAVVRGVSFLIDW